MTPIFDHDDGAVDAIMYIAYLKDLASAVPALTGPEPMLSPDDRRALDALGPDLVSRIISGDVRPRPRSDPASDLVAPGFQIAGAMHRGGEDGELTDAAREEMERKIREIEEGDEKPGAAP